ncbi:hypothetical protein ACOSQ3_014573 [Xanthoceras sorbifolium]
MCKEGVYGGKWYGGYGSVSGSYDNIKNEVKAGKTSFVSGESSKGGKTSSDGNNGSRIDGSRFEILTSEKIKHEVSLVNNQKKRLHHSSSKQKEVFNDITNVSGKISTCGGDKGAIDRAKDYK